MECCFLYADWNGLKLLEERIKGCMRDKTSRSKILDKVCKLEIGL